MDMIKQWLDVEGDLKKVTLTNQINLEPVLQDNYETRQNVGKGLGKTWRPIGSVPRQVLEADIDGLAFLHSVPGSVEERKALRKFMMKYPEYRTSNGRF